MMQLFSLQLMLNQSNVQYVQYDFSSLIYKFASQGVGIM